MQFEIKKRISIRYVKEFYFNPILRNRELFDESTLILNNVFQSGTRKIEFLALEFIVGRYQFDICTIY
jgi:hypothetical protein